MGQGRLRHQTRSMPNNNKIIITGANQNFFRSFMKSQRSFIKSCMTLDLVNFTYIIPEYGRTQYLLSVLPPVHKDDNYQ